jgi:hypothetical protein
MYGLNTQDYFILIPMMMCCLKLSFFPPNLELFESNLNLVPNVTESEV